MTIVVFVGPSVPVEDAQRALDAVYRPPAAQGDVYRAARQRPHAIGLVNGYFERVPAVFHKEIAGFADLAAFRRALLRERAFAGTRSAPSPSDTPGS